MKKATGRNPEAALAQPGATESGAKKTPAKKQAARKMLPKKKALPASPPAPPDQGAMVMDRLYAVIMSRRTADPARSHSARLLSRGTAKVAQKFGEEAVECLIEAVAGNTAALVGESADVLYHLLVMWVACGVEPHQIWAELQRREGVSGVDEKAARALPGTSKIP